MYVKWDADGLIVNQTKGVEIADDSWNGEGTV